MPSVLGWGDRPTDDELSHFLLLRQTIEALGGDSTVVTPSADFTAVMSMGFSHVLHDPRTRFRHCLEAILVAELADNDCWTVLVDFAEELRRDDLAARFRVALASEQRHLVNVRAWVKAAIRSSPGVPVLKSPS